MDETNPLCYHSPPKPRSFETNRSGRPTNEKIVIFGPQPKSIVSQMLKKLKEERGNSPVSINSLNKGPQKCMELENCDEHRLSNQIVLEQDVKVAKNTIRRKDNEPKLYPCDYQNCKYVCKSSSNLIKHKRTHTSEKPYLCDLCSFRSNFINSLKVHQRIHTAEKPYHCKHCSYRCNSSSNLKKHCKHRHNSMPVQDQQ